MEEIVRKEWFNLHAMAHIEYLLNNMGYLHSNCGCFGFFPSLSLGTNSSVNCGSSIEPRNNKSC